METAGVTAWTKALDALRAIPLWLLAAMLISVLMIWAIPAFHDAIPEARRPWIPLAIAVVAVLVLCSAADLAASNLNRRRRAAAERDRLRLVHLYRPLATLFLTRHVTATTGVRAPRLRDRIENAWSKLASYRRHRVAVRRAFWALFDRQISTSAEVE